MQKNIPPLKNIFEKTIELEWVTLLNTMTNVVSHFKKKLKSFVFMNRR
jgi:hypothetical protein